MRSSVSTEDLGVVLTGWRLLTAVLRWLVIGIYSQAVVCNGIALPDVSTKSSAKSKGTELNAAIVESFKHRFTETRIRPDDFWSIGVHVSPVFDNATSRNVTTQRGQTAYLHCVVINLGDKMVSWIRRRDFHVLTVGMDTYTSDERFQAVHIERTNDWALQIKFVQLRDAGLYECQVSSDPKISYFVNLAVVVAKAGIEGAPDLYVKSGSAINLTCVISPSPEPPIFVFWYHDERMINYDSSRGQITMHKATRDTTFSRLYIKDAQSYDSGNYTCCPSNAEAASITVHILNGEKPAAMQHDGSSFSGTEKQSFVVCYILNIVHLIILLIFR